MLQHLSCTMMTLPPMSMTFPLPPFLCVFSLNCPRLGRGSAVGLAPAASSMEKSHTLLTETPYSPHTWVPAPPTKLTQVYEIRAAPVFASCGAITGTSWTFECS